MNITEMVSRERLRKFKPKASHPHERAEFVGSECVQLSTGGAARVGDVLEAVNQLCVRFGDRQRYEAASGRAAFVQHLEFLVDPRTDRVYCVSLLLDNSAGQFVVGDNQEAVKLPAVRLVPQPL